MSDNEYYKEWKKKHPDYQKKWKKKHPDYQKKWRKEHPEHMKKYNKRCSFRKDEVQTETLLHADNKYSRWTVDDIEKLKKYISDGLTYSEISAKLHRTLYAIDSRVNLLKRKGEM